MEVVLIVVSRGIEVVAKLFEIEFSCVVPMLFVDICSFSKFVVEITAVGVAVFLIIEVVVKMVDEEELSNGINVAVEGVTLGGKEGTFDGGMNCVGKEVGSKVGIFVGLKKKQIP